VLLVGSWLFLLGTPGLDFLDSKDQGVIGRFNRAVRVPLIRPLEPIQKPFRIAQNWSLYRDGPARVRRLEVWVAGELRYRSLDSEYDWLAPQLRSRRLRPVVESSCRYTSGKARNWRGLTRYVAERALERWPEATQVQLTCTVSPFPGEDARPTHRMEASAPDWTPRREIL